MSCVHLWERRATEDVGASSLRFRCARCGKPGSKCFGEPDSAVRELSREACLTIEHKRENESFRIRSKRAAEDAGFHPDQPSIPQHNGGLPQS